jgi:hypothetical protein
MRRNTIFRAAVVGACALLATSALGHADPSTPMPAIESSAAQLCSGIDAHPTPGGIVDGMAGLDNRGLDEIDGALVLITAIHHVCPQHEALVMGVMDGVVAEEVCTEPT